MNRSATSSEHVAECRGYMHAAHPGESGVSHAANNSSTLSVKDFITEAPLVFLSYSVVTFFRARESFIFPVLFLTNHI